MSIIRLDLSECPYPPSPKVVKVISDSASTINRYPKMLGGLLPDALTAYTGKSKEQIVIGNGSDDLIELIIKIFTHPNEQILIPIPSFPGYWYAAKNLDKEVIFVNRDNEFGLDIDSILQKITSKVKVIFIANPNNPTANLIPCHILAKLIQQVNCLIVVDECYYEFSQETVADLIDMCPNLIILRSFSKGFGLAGLRLGYAITNAELASRLRNSTQLFGVNTLAQAAAITVLTDLEYYYAQIEQINKDRTNLRRGLEQLGFDVYPSATNFLFVGTEKLNLSSSYLEKSLQNQDIHVKNCGMLPGLDDFYFRTTVGNYKENHILLAKLAKMRVQ
jgi:histidinol-phosphate aminotransferase